MSASHLGGITIISEIMAMKKCCVADIFCGTLCVLLIPLKEVELRPSILRNETLHALTLKRLSGTCRIVRNCFGFKLRLDTRQGNSELNRKELLIIKS